MVRSKSKKAAGKTPARRKAARNELTDKGKQKIKSAVQACFRAAFIAKKAAELANLNRQYQDTFVAASGTKESIEYFVFCQRFALELLCVKGAKEGWANCLRMVTNVALVLSSNGVFEPLDALLELVEQTHNVNSMNARIFGCQLAGVIFLLSGVVDALNVERGIEESREPGDTPSSLSQERRSSLYKVILARHTDPGPSVRLQAVRAFSYLQEEKYPFVDDDPPDLSPKQVLLRHFRDISWECRVAAVRSLSLETNDDVNVVLGRAFSDFDPRVRRASFLRLAQDVHIRRLSIANRMKVIKHMLQANEAAVRVTALRVMLKKWLGDVMGDDEERNALTADGANETRHSYLIALTEFFELLEPVNEEELTHDVLVVALRCCRQLANLENEEVRQFVQSIVDCGEDTFIHRCNYKNLLDNKWTSQQLEKKAFLWRCVLDYCKAECVSEADWSECRCLLVPTLHTFSEFLRPFIETESADNGPERLIYMRIATIQLLKMIPLLELDDATGRKTWRGVIEFILGNRQCNISREVIECAVRQLFEHFYPNPEDLDDGLSYICDLTSMMVHRSVDPDASQRMADETIALNLGDGGGNPAELPEADDDTMLRCVTIVNAMLRTNRLQKINALLLGLLENVVEKGALSAVTECRVLSMEAMGEMALFKKELAYEKTAYLKDVLEVEDHPQLKVTALEILCKHCLRYGYADVSKWFAGDTDFGDPSCDLLKVLCNYADDEDPNVSFAACELLCKLLLNDVEVESVRKTALSRIVLKSLDPLLRDNPKLKKCLSSFVQIFGEIDREHQLYYVDIFTDVFDTLKSAEPEDSLTRIDPLLVVNLFIHVTCYQILTGPSKKGGSVHPVLARKMLESIEKDIEGKFVSCYCSKLPELDVMLWTDTALLEEIACKTDKLIEQFEVADLQGRDVRSLASFVDKLRKQIAKVDVSKAPRRGKSASVAREMDTEELADRAANLILSTPATSRKASETTRTGKATSTARRRGPRVTKASRGLAQALYEDEREGGSEEGAQNMMTPLFSAARTPLARRPRRAAIGTANKSVRRLSDQIPEEDEREKANDDDDLSSEGSPEFL